MSILKNIETGDEYKKEALDSTTFVYNLGLSKMHPALLMNGLVYGPNQVHQLLHLCSIERTSIRYIRRIQSIVSKVKV